MVEKIKKSGELPQEILKTWGNTLIEDLFASCKEYPEYLESEGAIGADGRKTVIFFLDKVRYSINFDPSALENLENLGDVPQRAVLKKRRGDFVIEERVTIVTNGNNPEITNKILYEKFHLLRRMKKPLDSKKNNWEAITNGRRLVNVRRPLDLSL